VPAPTLDLAVYVVAERQRILQGRELLHVEGNLHDLRRTDPVPDQVVAKKAKQEKALSAAPDSSDDLDKAIVPPFDKAVKVSVSPDGHASTPL
jgi:hypothetical protein